MAFQQGLSGLNTASKALDATSNNIANASTVGFKSSTVHFGDVYAASLAGGGASQVGIGGNVGAIQQQFTQGNLTSTNNPLDISINGAGFFKMDNNGATSYTRNGQFHLDKNGYIVNDQALKLTGYGAQSGIVVPSTPSPIQISASDLPPIETGTSTALGFTGVKANLQLDSRATVPLVSPWISATSKLTSDVTSAVTANGGSALTAAAVAAAAVAASGPAAAASAAVTAAGGSAAASAAASAAVAEGGSSSVVSAAVKSAVLAAGGSAMAAAAGAAASIGTYTPDPQSYNFSTALSIYDSLGNSHALTMYFVKTATPGQWETHFNVDGTSDGYVTPQGGTLTFDSAGKLTSAPIKVKVDLTAVNGALSLPSNASSPIGGANGFDLNFTGTTQFGSAFGTNRLEQDGYAAGHLVGLSVGSDGVIQGRYSNGQTFAQGQVVMANFTNPNGLQSLGSNQWVETSTSGPALIGAPNTSNLGTLSSSTVEESNVDLTAELVNLITQQRNYQANAQSIKTQDQVLQTLVNLR